jgi:hypothetical protein
MKLKQFERARFDVRNLSEQSLLIPLHIYEFALAKECDVCGEFYSLRILLVFPAQGEKAGAVSFFPWACATMMQGT